MSSFSFDFSNSDVNDSSMSNLFGTVSSDWMSDLQTSDSEGSRAAQQKQQLQNKAGQRVNSAPTKLCTTNKKTNWGAVLGKKKGNNKRKYRSTNNKRSMSLNLSVLDTDMSGLQVLSPKTEPEADNVIHTAVVVKPFALNSDSSTSNIEEVIGLGNPKHKRSKNGNSEQANLQLVTGNILKKVMSNRSAAALGKLRGSYKCGKCGVPKKGHICPHELPKETKDAETQCSFDINPKVESVQIRRLVQKLQEKGIISLSGSSDSLGTLLNSVEVPLATYQQENTAGGSPAKIVNEASKSKKLKGKRSTKSSSKVRKQGNVVKKKKKKSSTKSNLIPSSKKGFPKRVNSLRTFDSIESTNSDNSFDMHMDPTDAFEFDIANDELSDDAWFNNDMMDVYDEDTSAMLSA